jgi:hypothetical protein
MKQLIPEEKTRSKPEFNWLKKSRANPNSRKMAIAAACFQCFGGSEDDMPDEGWIKQIRTCTSPDCALYSHRPYKEKGKKDGS